MFFHLFPIVAYPYILFRVHYSGKNKGTHFEPIISHIYFCRIFNLRLEMLALGDTALITEHQLLREKFSINDMFWGIIFIPILKSEFSWNLLAFIMVFLEVVFQTLVVYHTRDRERPFLTLFAGSILYLLIQEVR